MKTVGLISLLLSISTPLFSQFSQFGDKVIYGEDNRQEVFLSNPIYQDLAKSAASQIDSRNIREVNDELTVVGQTLFDMGICNDERFAIQVAGSKCSGFLVGPDLIATAGHCVKTEDDCKNFSWVFDYKITDSNQSKVTLKKENIYTCSQIVSRMQDVSSGNDFAIIRLSKQVKDRTPLKFRRANKVPDDANLFVIGNPVGLPTKIADKGMIRANDSEKFFVTNLDTYGGNSGSAVINSQTLEVEGILVRGEDDFVFDPQANCSRSKVCDPLSCRGEDVTRITNFSVLKKLVPANHR